MSDTVRVYVNGKGLDVVAGATVLDAVRAFDGALAAGVESGARLITDSRGLPIGADAPVAGGSIFRIITNRAGQSVADLPEA
ncbi:MAG: hypothetical protein JWO05_3427 [Gemmatimonadetes bacterium]|nr:hypothetical protein [Gemmatimonadota bacterium]